MNLLHSTTPILSNSWDGSHLLLTNPFWLLVQSLSNQALFLIDRTGMILTWNTGAESLLGYPAEEIIGQNFSILYPLKDQANHQFDLHFQLALDRNRLETVSHWIKKNGTSIAAQFILTALYENETHVGFSVCMNTLTDSQRTEVRLHASERRLQAFFETPTAGMADASINGRILRVNDAFCRMLGYSREELVRMTVPDILFPEDRAPVMAQYSQVGKGVSVSYHSERRYRRKDGSILWAHVNVAEVRDEAGNPSEISAVVIDLGARKQAEFELERQRAELQIILDTVPAWIFFKNREHRIIRVNAEVSRGTGFSVSELEGKTDEELGLPDAARYRQDEDEVFATGKPKRGIIETVRTKKGTRWLQTEKLPL
jgi:two-component system cell cycle sensor histidine kinase/response regulator CckA